MHFVFENVKLNSTKKMSEELSMNQVFYEKFGSKELSERIGISRSQLHRKLNTLVQKSTSQFIREFRLEKAMVMII